MMFLIPADDEMLSLITRASRITRLSKSEVARQSIRLGAAEPVRRCTSPKPTLLEYLTAFKGLEIRKRRHPLRRSL